MSLRRTPLYDAHIAAGGRMVDFGGWELPVQYSGITQEHQAVRTACGLFDVSHMGEILVTGEGALAFINSAITNDASRLTVGRIQYSMICYEHGGVVDDILVYHMGENEYLLVVNAANTEKVFEFLSALPRENTQLSNVSTEWAQIAVQGPKAAAVVERVLGIDTTEMKYYSFITTEIDGQRSIVSRTGYTGEDGFELYVPPAIAPALWDRLLELGRENGLIPCGLGARDTLRFEAGMPLYGHELSENITPFEAGLGFFVKLQKECDFSGKEALMGLQTPTRKRIGLEMLGRGIARAEYPVYAGERKVGFVTSGSPAPTLGKNLAMALVDTDYESYGPLSVEIRGKKVEATAMPLPFYKKSK